MFSLDSLRMTVDMEGNMYVTTLNWSGKHVRNRSGGRGAEGAEGKGEEREEGAEGAGEEGGWTVWFVNGWHSLVRCGPV